MDSQAPPVPAKAEETKKPSQNDKKAPSTQPPSSEPVPVVEEGICSKIVKKMGLGDTGPTFVIHTVAAVGVTALAVHLFLKYRTN